jgi:hypothetical protein
VRGHATAPPDQRESLDAERCETVQAYRFRRIGRLAIAMVIER